MVWGLFLAFYFLYTDVSIYYWYRENALGAEWGHISEKVSHFSRLVMSDPLQPHGLHHTRLPCPSPTPRAYSNSCPAGRWCYPTISFSVIPFSSSLQSFQALGSFLMSQTFISDGQSIGLSASVLPMNIQGWYPFSSVQSLSHVWLLWPPWTVACHASLSFTNSRSLLKLMSKSVMPSDQLIFCCPLLLLLLLFPSIRIFSNESGLCIRWLKY